VPKFTFKLLGVVKTGLDNMPFSSQNQQHYRNECRTVLSTVILDITVTELVHVG